MSNQVSGVAVNSLVAQWLGLSLGCKSWNQYPIPQTSLYLRKKTKVSRVAALSQDASPGTARRSANFHPSIWGDHFLTYASESVKADEKTQQQVWELKEKVRMMLIAPVEKPSQKLNLIDTIQRLGVSYHFEGAIHEILWQLHKTLYDHDDHENNEDLYTVALQFRLLRQAGYHISCDKFAKFMDNQGKFKESLINDVQGMLSLYEAAHLRMHGEDILDEALVFTTTNLEAIEPHLSPPIAAQVSHALKRPIHKGIPRLEARYYLSIYQQEASHNEVLHTFGKLDFNLLQKFHQKELSEISWWWKDLCFSGKFNFARDRVVECYFWAAGIYFEPEYHLCRTILTKVLAMTSILDDIYDVYGTFEELELLTEAIERWDMDAIDQLPEYMKVYYQALLDTYNEIDQKVGEGRSYRSKYVREVMKNQVRAYHHEAKWLSKKYIPTFNEYMDIATVSSAGPVFSTLSLVGMGDVVTRDSFEWLFSYPKALKASLVICRLMSDIVSHKFEQERGHIPSAVECYMIQHGVTEEEANKELRKQVANAWKDLNKECLSGNSVPMPIVMPLLNLARSIDVVYMDDDGYTRAEVVLKDFIASMLVDPVPL